MVEVNERDISALVAAFALAASVPLGRRLRHWSHRRIRAAESFAAGVSLSYVIVDLMVELTAVGGQHVHSTIPIGPTYEKSLFAVVLAGAAWWYVVAALAARVGHRRARYRAYIVPQVVYCVFAGGALSLEAEHGARQLLLFALPMLLHLTVVESHMFHEFEDEHVGFSCALLALAPAFGAAAWAFLGIPQAVLFMALALVAGSTVVQIIQTELPSADVVRIGPFLVGVCLYSSVIAARWASVPAG
jgi:hypothetical protein